MALDLSAFESTEEEDALFDKAPFDKAAGRKKLLARFERAGKQVNGKLGKQGGTDYEIGHNDKIRFRPTLNAKRIYLKDEQEPYFPSDTKKFGALIESLMKATNEGHFDDQIEAALAPATETVADPVPAPATTTAKKPKAAKLATVGSVKQSATRMQNTYKKSEAEIREYLEGEGVREEWIKAAIDNLPK